MEILALHRYGEIENSNEVADFEAISARNRLSIAYCGFKIVLSFYILSFLVIAGFRSIFYEG
ncbi:hypothetical protein [Cyclobacterium amurskyense]|uniref:hypothetical protein n=1 Tax=Cyclobacterium amurskyense TaxID=320787 RepID=UPI0012F94537|nr:hypothetical protein [Cyclobacterium amurskyense]